MRGRLDLKKVMCLWGGGGNDHLKWQDLKRSDNCIQMRVKKEYKLWKVAGERQATEDLREASSRHKN